jgi:hypothetical protein
MEQITNIIRIDCKRACAWLITNGFVVTQAVDIPGLYRVNDGPELTATQLISFARQQGFS